MPPASDPPFAGQDHRQRTTLTTYAMLLSGSSQASGPAPSFTEGAQTINNSFFIPQYTNSVNACFDILSSRSMQNGGHSTPFVTPFLPNLLRPNLLRPMVEPFYQPGNGLSRWKYSTDGLAPPRLQGYYNLHAGGCLVDILSTNRKKNVPNLDTFVRRILTTTGQEAIIKGKKDGLPGSSREVGQLNKFSA